MDTRKNNDVTHCFIDVNVSGRSTTCVRSPSDHCGTSAKCGACGCQAGLSVGIAGSAALCLKLSKFVSGGGRPKVTGASLL